MYKYINLTDEEKREYHREARRRWEAANPEKAKAHSMKANQYRKPKPKPEREYKYKNLTPEEKRAYHREAKRRARAAKRAKEAAEQVAQAVAEGGAAK